MSQDDEEVRKLLVNIEQAYTRRAPTPGLLSSCEHGFALARLLE